MKKFILVLALAVSFSMLNTGCGPKEEEATQGAPTKEELAAKKAEMGKTAEAAKEAAKEAAE